MSFTAFFRPIISSLALDIFRTSLTCSVISSSSLNTWTEWKTVTKTLHWNWWIYTISLFLHLPPCGLSMPLDDGKVMHHSANGWKDASVFYTLHHIFDRKPFRTMTHRFVNTVIGRVSNYSYFVSVLCVPHTWSSKSRPNGLSTQLLYLCIVFSHLNTKKKKYNTLSSLRRKEHITSLKPTKMMTDITEMKQTATIIHDYCCQWHTAKTRTEGKKLYPIIFHEKGKVHPVTCHEGTVRE